MTHRFLPAMYDSTYYEIDIYYYSKSRFLPTINECSHKSTFNIGRSMFAVVYLKINVK